MRNDRVYQTECGIHPEGCPRCAEYPVVPDHPGPEISARLIGGVLLALSGGLVVGLFAFIYSLVK